MRRHTYTCPGCDQTVETDAGYAARQQRPCRSCIRIRNGWTCQACGSTDPHHPSPCPAVIDDSEKKGAA